MSLMSCAIDVNAAATYVIAAALKTRFAPITSSSYNIPLVLRSCNALLDALNSTGKVIIWNKTTAVKSKIPI